MKILLFGRNLNSTLPSDKYKAELNHAKSMLGIKKDIAIVESKYSDVPFVYGAIKPRIVIPIHYIKHLGQNKISYIIMHELYHVKRRDVLINYIWLFAKAIHWFNPFTYLAHRYYKDSVEECCDETVASYLNDRKKSEYTQSLIDAMRFTKKRNNFPLSASFIGKKSAIRKRVIKMINPQKQSKAMLFITILLAVIMVVGCFTTACQPKENDKEETVMTDSSVKNSEYGISDEVLIKTYQDINEYYAILRTDIEYAWSTVIEPCGDDKIVYILFEGEETVIGALVSDSSLVSYYSKDIELNIDAEFSNKQYIDIAKEYINKIWAQDIVDIASCETIKSADSQETRIKIMGTLGENKQEFIIELSGDGNIFSMSSYPNDYSNDKWLLKSTLEEGVAKYYKNHLSIKKDLNFNLTNETSFVPYAPIYIFDYEFTPEDESEAYANYNWHISISAITGEKDVVIIGPEIFNNPQNKNDTSGIITRMDIPNMKDYVVMYIEEYYGDYIYHLEQNDEPEHGNTIYYEFLESDKSLISYYNPFVNTTVPLNYTRLEYEKMAKEHIKNIWGYIRITTISYSTENNYIPSKKDYSCEYTGQSTSDERIVFIRLNGDGEVITAQSFPKVDESKGLSIDEAYEISQSKIQAAAYLNKNNDVDKLTLVNKAKLTPGNPYSLYTYYEFYFKYRNPNPTATNFDYDCEVKISASSGEYYLDITPIIEGNPELIQLDVAEQMAKEHVAEVCYGSSDMWDRLTKTSLYLDVNEGDSNVGEIIYNFTFDYLPKETSDKQAEYTHQFSMTATGEFLEIHTYPTVKD